MKPSAIGHPRRTRSQGGLQAAFTLVELVVVMTIIVIVIGTVAPSFKGFLQGRNLNNEARRVLSLTHFGLVRAVGEGVPVDLWINVKQGRYGLAACGGYTETRTNAVEFGLDQGVQMMVSPPPGALTQSNYWTPSTTRGGSMPVIRFQPDGFISDTSPQSIVFRQGQGAQIWLVENPNHVRYDLQTDHAKATRF